MAYKTVIMATKELKGKDTFTKAEIEQLRGLIIELSKYPPVHDPRKGIRNKIRKLGFFGQDDWGLKKIKEADLDRLIKEKRITVI